MNLAAIRKAVAGFVASALPILTALLTYNVLPGNAAKIVSAVIVALTPVFTFLGVHQAPANTSQPPATPPIKAA